ncbi:hypothetical protein DXD59_00790 [Olsenella sp. TM06-36]|jgi:integrase|uniref:hypothetical protein n=1 Tax=unclassified Olsenella TaxID=2638792 RepID=UPI000E43F416|nr:MULTISPECIES: hypothetical protein [unclassified Olsenella]RGJ47466.1 hypothetical protein DXD59_00790 [Olsenella sp. TM06-36]RHJ96164.1 hypothetical protein DW092_00785 [Olsenella sp. AM05-7]RHK00402.1 hypothetical protein DW090_01335 [Olsenella sp. AM05-17]
MPRKSPEGIRETRPGVWEVRASSGHRSDGTRRTVSRTVHGTEADAVAMRARLLYELDSSRAFGDNATLVDLWPSFLARCDAKGLTNATMADYEKQWRLRIEPEFGDATVSSIRYGRVQSWVYTLAPGVARHAVRALKRLLNHAVDMGALDANPLVGRRMDYPIDRRPVVARYQWGATEVMECMRRLRGERVEPLWLALVGGGLRVEEGLALDWSDVTFPEGAGGSLVRVMVTKAWTEADGLKPPKNASSARVVPIGEPFAGRLMELRGDGPVYPLYRGAAARRWAALFREGGALHGMPPARLRDMRSVHETMMQEAGALDTVNARLHGRTNVQTGYTHYLRPSRALDDAALLLGESLTCADMHGDVG